MKLKKSFLLLPLSAVLFSVTACTDSPVVTSQAEQVVISLSWWGNDARNDYTLAAVQQFNELHPEIKVECSYSEWSGYESRSRVRMISDTESDVMQINFGWLSEYSPDGSGYYDIESLSEYIDLSAFSDDMLDYGRVNGILNAIPIAMNSETVYVNKTIYDNYNLDLPVTWDDLFDAAKVMSPDGIYPMSAGAKSMWLYGLSYAEQVSGKSFLNENGTLNFTSDDFELMIDIYCRLVREKVIPQVEYFERINIDSGTYAGTVAWVSDAVNYCGSAVNNGFDMTVADYTSADSDKIGDGWHAKPATMYAVSKNTEHPKEAAMLLDFLLNSREMAVLQGIEKGIPLSSSAKEYLEEEDMLSGLQYDASLEMENNALLTPMDPFVENSDVINAYTDACNLVLYDKSDPESAANELYNTVKELL